MTAANSPSSSSTDRAIADDGDRPITARVVPWIARLAWLIGALVGGGAVDAAVADRSEPVRWTAAIGGWALFGVVIVALLIPAPLSLAIARVASPLALVAAVGSVVAGGPALDVGLLLAPAVIAVAAIFSAEFGRWMVQASAYGDEDRLPLRSPLPAGAAAVISWIVWAAAVTTGPFALASRNWLVGVPVTVIAIAMTVFVGPRWYTMARRWLVFVPAGIVVHDPLVLADTLMIRRDQIVGIGLARADTQAADLTGPASGYAIQVDTNESVATVFAFTPKKPEGTAIHMTGFLVAPSRPGQALREARVRRLPIR